VCKFQGLDAGVGGLFQTSLLQFPLDFTTLVRLSTSLAAANASSASRVCPNAQFRKTLILRPSLYFSFVCVIRIITNRKFAFFYICYVRVLPDNLNPNQ